MRHPPKSTKYQSPVPQKPKPLVLSSRKTDLEILATPNAKTEITKLSWNNLTQKKNDSFLADGGTHWKYNINQLSELSGKGDTAFYENFGD